MCGIIGAVGQFNLQEIKHVAGTISHRGPDDFDIYSNDKMVFAQHRLAIIDLSPKGRQPYHFEHLTLIYNGEVYNYKSIRKELEKAGYHFESTSDTEVIIKSFHYWGVDCVQRFRGMFAFAVYNNLEESLYLFRDRMGVKPLYYTINEKGIVFGSELRTIIPFITNKEFDNKAIYEYFRLGYVSGDRTIYKNIKKLLSAHCLVYKQREVAINSYWSLEAIHTSQDTRKTTEEWQEELHQTMIEAFRMRMESDVPVGVFLSGGIDSSLVTAILQKHHGNINTFTIGFNDDRYNEAPYAKSVAAHIGTHHTELTMTVKDAAEMFDKFYDIYDEPFADSSGIPTAVVSHLARQHGVKVVLSANGGDELFAGYKHYFSALSLFDKFNNASSFSKKFLKSISGSLFKSGLLNGIFYNNIEHKIAVLNELSSITGLGDFYRAFLANQSHLELDNLLLNGKDEDSILFKREGIEGMLRHDHATYLPDDLLLKSDRATMFNSIEGREPFLDHKLVELAYQLPIHLKYNKNDTKIILKDILAQYVPRQLFERPKKGFSIPIFKWFSQHMDQLFEHYLNPAMVSKVGIFNVDEVEREYKKYHYFKSRGQESNIEKMWRLLSFMMWWDKWHNVK